jgi:hypothetical protein
MKHNLANRPDYMSDPELYRVGDSIDWTKYGLQCKEWFEAFENELRERFRTHGTFEYKRPHQRMRSRTTEIGKIIKELLGEKR